MNQLYHIKGWCPKPGMGTAGFGVVLWPAWKDTVERRGLTQGDVNHAVETMGRDWLDSHGYNQIFDPDNCGFDADKAAPPGPNAVPSYRPNRELRVTWGAWGPEHISVPGNACGLDLDKAMGGPRGGKALLPHNVDSQSQASLLLTVFLWFAECLILNELIASKN